MDGFGVGDLRTEVRGACPFDRIVTTGSVVLSAAGGSEAGTASNHRYLSSLRTSVRSIPKAFGARTAKACAGRAIVVVQDTGESDSMPRRGRREPDRGGRPGGRPLRPPRPPAPTLSAPATTGPWPRAGLMQDAVARWPVRDEDTVTIPAAPGRTARTAQVTLRAGSLTPKRPSRAIGREAAHEPPTLAPHLVAVEEPEPPEGQASLCWRLLTTRPVTAAAEAREMVRLYHLRWRIEEVFRALRRDGLGLDATQVRVPNKPFRLAALA